MEKIKWINQVKSSTYIIQQKVVLSYIFSLQKIRTEWNFKRHVFEYEENRGNDKYHFYTRLMWLNCLICWIITCVSLWESWVDFFQNNLYLILIGFWLSEKFFLESWKSIWMGGHGGSVFLWNQGLQNLMRVRRISHKRSLWGNVKIVLPFTYKSSVVSQFSNSEKQISSIIKSPFQILHFYHLYKTISIFCEKRKLRTKKQKKYRFLSVDFMPLKHK